MLSLNKLFFSLKQLCYCDSVTLCLVDSHFLTKLRTCKGHSELVIVLSKLKDDSKTTGFIVATYICTRIIQKNKQILFAVKLK